MKLKLKKSKIKNLSSDKKQLKPAMTPQIQGAGAATFFPCQTGLCGTHMTVDYGFSCDWDCGTSIC